MTMMEIRRALDDSFGEKVGQCTTEVLVSESCYQYGSCLTNGKMRMKVFPVTVNMILHHFAAHHVSIAIAISFQ